jgi:hypothetical protein
MHARIVTFRLEGPTHEQYAAQATAAAGAITGGALAPRSDAA